jgi:AraC family transcriptional activator of pobA
MEYLHEGPLFFELIEIFININTSIMKTIIRRNEPLSDVHFSLFIDNLHRDAFNGEGFFDPVNRPYHQVVLISKGTGHCRIDLEDYKINNNSVCLIPPNRYFQFKPSGDLSGIIISFDACFLTFAIQGSGEAFIADTEVEMRMVNVIELSRDIALLENLCREMREELQAPDILQLESISGLFKRFLVQLRRCGRIIRQEEPSTRKMRLFHDFYQKVDRHYKSKKFVSEYARELSVTASYLNDVVRHVTGHSASYHISQRVIQEAKRQALYSDANMKMVANSLGFIDPAHFSKFFRRGAGINFSEFKKVI